MRLSNRSRPAGASCTQITEESSRVVDRDSCSWGRRASARTSSLGTRPQGTGSHLAGRRRAPPTRTIPRHCPGQARRWMSLRGDRPPVVQGVPGRRRRGLEVGRGSASLPSSLEGAPERSRSATRSKNGAIAIVWSSLPNATRTLSPFRSSSMPERVTPSRRPNESAE
jgi:hypothetical protein